MAFKIVRNDITRVKADVLVNSANTKPICAGYRTDAAIYEAAGYDEMLAARQKIGVIEVGCAEVTPAFKLPAKYVVHTVGPRWVDGKSGEPEALRSCYRESLSKAVALRAKSIAFPLISTGAFKFPKDLALDIATEVSKEFTSEHKLDVILVVYDNESFELTSDLSDFVSAYIDEHYVGELTDYRLKQYEKMNSPQDRLWKWKGPAEESVCIEKVEVPAATTSYALKKTAAFTSFTGKLEEEIQKKIKDLEIYTFGQRLGYYVYEKDTNAAKVYSSIYMDRKHFSKLLADKIKQPKRETVLALAIGLNLNVVETRDLLSHAGYSFTPGNNLTDVIVAAFLEKGIYDITRINIALENNNLPQLG